MKEIGHWINGKLVAGTSGKFADVFNPATGEVQARVAVASKAELDAATADAAKAQGNVLDVQHDVADFFGHGVCFPVGSPWRGAPSTALETGVVPRRTPGKGCPAAK